MMQTQTVSISSAYGFMALTSDIGGSLGLLLEATRLNVIEVVDFTGHRVLVDIKLRREIGANSNLKQIQVSSCSNMSCLRLAVAIAEIGRDC